jgi:hypothetical protein
MFSRKFTVISHLLATMFLINCVTSADLNGGSSEESRKSQTSDESLMSTETSQLFVATTQKIEAKSASSYDR